MANRRQEEWQTLLTEYRASKESVGVFCKRHKISDSSLYYWLGKDKELRPNQVSMLPVVAAESKLTVDRAELVMPKGIILRFSVGTSARYMADIIKALA
jgi:hypothetical protein